MSRNDHATSHTPTIPPNSPRNCAPLVLSPEEEAESLATVHQRLRRWHGQEKASTSGFFLRLRPALVALLTGGATVMAGLVLLFWHGNAPPLQLVGVTPISASKGPSALAWYKANDAQQAQAEVLGHWQIKAAPTTQFALAQTQSPRRQNVILNRGTLQIHVVPGKMKTFRIQSQGYQVVVKGTRFSVTREKDWLRVEVQRGRVALVTPTGQTTLLRAKEGIRVDLTSHVRTSYALPPSLKTPFQRAQWLSRHNPSMLHQYGLDLTHDLTLSVEQRARILRWIADQQQKAKQFEWAKQTLLALYRAHLSSGESEYALFEAAQVCRRAHPPTRSTCARLYRRYLKAYPLGLWVEHALFQSAMARGQHPTKPDTSELRTYARRFPTGHYIVEVRRALSKAVWDKGRGCNAAFEELAPNDSGPAWLRKLCPSRHGGSHPPKK